MCLFGDSLRSCCVAVVVPDEEVLFQWAKKHNKKDKSLKELCCDEVSMNLVTIMEYMYLTNVVFVMLGS